VIRWIFLLLLVAFSVPALAAEAVWLPFDSLPAGERRLAEATLAEMFGGDPSLWPDWLEPRATLVPTGDGPLLVVRQPVRAPCGQYRFSVFAPVSGGRRARLGEDFCAGQLSVMPRPLADWPDLLFAEGWVQSADGWHSEARRVRWDRNRWVLIQ